MGLGPKRPRSMGPRPRPQPPTVPNSPIPMPSERTRVLVTAFLDGAVVVPRRAIVTLDDGTIYAGIPRDTATQFDLPSTTVLKDANHGGWQATFTIDDDAYDPMPQRFELAPEVNLSIRRRVRSLPPLTINGQFLRANGQRFTWIEATSFLLYKRFIQEGVRACRPVLSQLHDLGFNAARIFLMNDSVGRIHPFEHHDFFAGLPEFCSLLAEFAIYPSFVAGTQWATLMDANRQVNYLEQLYHTLYDIACVISKVNENDQHDNRISDLARLLSHPPVGAKFLLSNGSNGAGGGTVEPVADIGEYHTNDLDQWPRKVGHGPMEKIADVFNIPVWSSENTRADHDGYNLVHAYDAGRNGALLCMGSCCHTEEGKLAQVLTLSEPWARAWATGARSVRLQFQDGNYVHLENEEAPGIVRVHARQLGSDFERSIVHWP